MAASRAFANAPQALRFLRFVVAETLAGKGAGLKGYTIGLAVLGKPADFDPQVDSAVRVAAGRLRKALDRYYAGAGAGDPIRIEIPRGAYRPRFHPHPPPAVPGGGAGNARGVAERDSDGGPSLAVVGFVDLNPDGGSDYLAVGITEELVIALTRFADLRVVGPLSAAVLQGRGLDAVEAGRRYGTRFVLEGSVRHDDGRLRVGVKLTDSASAFKVWAQVYERPLANGTLAGIEADICRRVAGTLGDKSGMILRHLMREALQTPIEDLTVHQAVLRYYHFTMVMSRGTHRRALKALELARGCDPGCPLTRAALGAVHSATYMLGIDDDPVHLNTAQRHVDRAVALHPFSHRIQQIRARVGYRRRDMPEFREAADLALSLNPHASSNGEIGLMMMLSGHYDEGLRVLRAAQRLNPHHPGTFHGGTYFHHARTGDFRRALEVAARIRMPRWFWDPLLRIAALGHLGRGDQAAGGREHLLELVPDFPSRGRSLIERAIPDARHVELLCSGLERGGLAVG